MAAHEIAGHTSVCRKHGQFIDGGNGCPVCAGAPKRAKYEGNGGVRDHLRNRSHGETDRDDWEWV